MFYIIVVFLRHSVDYSYITDAPFLHAVQFNGGRMKNCNDCLAGVFGRPSVLALRLSCQCLRLLLRANISHHQTPEQDGQWSRRGAWPGLGHGDRHLGESYPWTGSAAGHSSGNWWQVISYGD